MDKDVMNNNNTRNEIQMAEMSFDTESVAPGTSASKPAKHQPIMRRYEQRDHNRLPHNSTHLSVKNKDRPESRGTSMYQMKHLDADAREDEEEALEKSEQQRIKRHKNKMKGDGTLSGRYMRSTFLQYNGETEGRKSVKIRDASELKNGQRLKEIRAVKSLVIEDETDSVDKLPETITSMDHIDELIIRFCKTKSLPHKITNLNRVVTLTLNETHLKDMDIICKLTSLKQLDVSKNLLKHVPAAIGSLVLLETLNISGNFIQVLPSQVGSLNNLLHLTTASNRLHHLPDAICKLTNLRVIDASRNVLESLPDDLGKLSSLTELNVGHNKLDYMPESLRSMRKLKYLYAPRNRLTDIFDGFTDLVALENLHLQDNAITQISGCPQNVRVLLVNNNKITDVSLFWRALCTIRTLSLRANHIAELPNTTMSGAASIRSLYLDENPIRALPDALSQNINLCHLTISNTQIPHIPHTVLHLPKLTVLESINNRLDPTLQMAASRGLDILRKAYDSFIPTSPPEIPGVVLRRNSSKADNNGQVRDDKRSSKSGEGQGRDEKRSSKSGEGQGRDEKRSSRIQEEARKSRDDSRHSRSQDEGRHSRLQDNGAPSQDTLQKRLRRTNLNSEEHGETNVTEETSTKPLVQDKPKIQMKLKPVVQDKPAVASKPQVNGGQKTSFLFSRPT